MPPYLPHIIGWMEAQSHSLVNEEPTACTLENFILSYDILRSHTEAGEIIVRGRTR